jgi:hypothetical protein
MMASQVLAEFEWERRGFVRATRDEFKGNQYVSLRLWVEPKNAPPGSDLIPTSKGLSIPAAYASDLVECVQALAAAAPKTTARRRRAA